MKKEGTKSTKRESMLAADPAGERRSVKGLTGNSRSGKISWLGGGDETVQKGLPEGK